MSPWRAAAKQKWCARRAAAKQKWCAKRAGLQQQVLCKHRNTQVQAPIQHCSGTGETTSDHAVATPTLKNLLSYRQVPDPSKTRCKSRRTVGILRLRIATGLCPFGRVFG